MPIRFQCDQCGQHLSIARRKAGVEIDCPRCGLRQPVPGEPEEEDSPVEEPSGLIEEPAIKQSPPMPEPGSTGEPLPDESSQGDEEGQEEQDSFLLEVDPLPVQPPPIPENVSLSDTIEISLLPEFPPVTVSPPPPPPPVARQVDDAVIAAPRRLPFPWAIYAQALLLLVVALGAFGSGYYLGRQDAAAPGVPAPVEGASPVAIEPDDGFSNEKVLLEVRLFWNPEFSEMSGDQSAVFIALPERRIPRLPLPTAGLQPAGKDAPGRRNSVSALEAAGGAFARTEADGTAAVVIPREGDYYLLLISSNALRPDDRPIRPRDLAAMRQYFAQPEEIIGPHKYAWLRQEIRVGAPAIEHDFGLSGL